MKFINVRELKSKTSEILRAAAGESIVVTNRGKPIAVIKGITDTEFEIRGSGSRPGGIRETPAPYGPAERTLENLSEFDRTSPGKSPSWKEFPPSDSTAAVKTRKGQNPLKAVFWDYPELTDEAVLSGNIREARAAPVPDTFRWYLARFLEHGRIADTIRFFSLDEIRRALPSLKISHRAAAGWTRVIDFYEHPD